METNVPAASHPVYVASRFVPVACPIFREVGHFVPVAPPISRAVGHLLDAVFRFRVERVP